MTVDISHLPKSMRRRPEIRALTLRVYRNGARSFQVPGDSRIYDVAIVDGTLNCTCKAASCGSICAHVLAVKSYMKKEQSHE